MRLPEWKVGEERQLLLPSSLKVSGRLRGWVASGDMLPQSGNAIGDTWVVGGTPYVWMVAPGAAQADWIDP